MKFIVEINTKDFFNAAGAKALDKRQIEKAITSATDAVTITADPQIVRGRQNQVLTLMGVGSDITIQNGTGLATMASAPFVISSGSVITFMYQSGGTVWQETSRNTGVSFV